MQAHELMIRIPNQLSAKDSGGKQRCEFASSREVFWHLCFSLDRTFLPLFEDELFRAANPIIRPWVSLVGGPDQLQGSQKTWVDGPLHPGPVAKNKAIGQRRADAIEISPTPIPPLPQLVMIGEQPANRDDNGIHLGRFPRGPHAPEVLC